MIMEEEKSKKNDDKKFDILTPGIMEYISKYIGYEWNLLAFNLGLTRADVAKIDAKYTESRNKTNQMLLIWLERHNNDRKRLNSLVTALERSSRKDLAQKIHCAQWSEQQFIGFEMPSKFPMLVRINKVRPRMMKTLNAPVINDLNPTTCNPVHSLNPRFIQIM